MVIKGFSVPAKANPRAENVKFVNGSGTETDKVFGSDNFYAQADVYDTSSYLVAALYSESGTLKKIFSSKCTYQEIGSAYRHGRNAICI